MDYQATQRQRPAVELKSHRRTSPIVHSVGAGDDLDRSGLSALIRDSFSQPCNRGGRVYAFDAHLVGPRLYVQKP